MKRLIYILFLVIFFQSTFLILNSYGQWLPDVRLTNDPGDSFTSPNWCIASNGNNLYVVWYDTRDGNYEIYYKRSSDGGTTWGADTRLTTNDSNGSYSPSIAVSGSQVNIVWADERNGNYEIYYKRSTDGGTTWGSDTRLTNNTANSDFPSVAVYGSQVNVVWKDNRDGNDEIYYKRSTDGGTTWGSDTRLTNNTATSYYPSIAVSSSQINVVWHDIRDGNNEIYYKRSTDGGTTWGADTRLTNNTANSNIPSIAVLGSQINVVWYDNRDSNQEIYYKRSTDGGTNWEADTRLTNNTAVSSLPSIAVSGSQVHVVWNDYRDGNQEIYYKSSTDGGTTWESDTRLTNSIGNSYNSSVSVSGSQVYIVWNDYRDGNQEIYYKKTVPPIPAIPSLVSPLNYSTGQSLNLSMVWNITQYSTKYRVLLATDSLFANIIMNDSLLTDSVKNLTNLNHLTKYYWKVSAGNISGWGGFSSVWNFTTVPPLPLAPTLILPLNNATNQVPNLLLDWGSVVNAASYRVQIANDSLFTSMVFDTSNVNRDSLRVRLGLLIVNTKYFWRVNATNVTGTGPWSTVWNFRISPVGINILGNVIPNEFKLYNNYPNPFNPTTVIRFSLTVFGLTTLKVYDIMGREVQTLVNERLQPGTYETSFDGSHLTSGVYFYKIQAGEFVDTKRMLMIK